MRSEGEPALNRQGDDAVDKCYENIGIVHDFYRKVFGRKSIDDQGMPLTAVVHYDFYFPGAWWHIPPATDAAAAAAASSDAGSGPALPQQALIFGDGWANDPWQQGAALPTFAGCFGNFAGSLEVVAHEMTHGVVHATARLDPTGPPGALHEHLADVFGALVEQWHRGQTVAQADWLVGEDLIAPAWKGVALRSIKAPGTAYDLAGVGKDPQVDHMDGLFTGEEDGGGVHINSGILNRAFYLVAMKMGGKAWERAGKIWYAALRDRKLTQQCDFVQWAMLTVSCAKKFGQEGWGHCAGGLEDGWCFAVSELASQRNTVGKHERSWRQDCPQL